MGYNHPETGSSSDFRDFYSPYFTFKVRSIVLVPGYIVKTYTILCVLILNKVGGKKTEFLGKSNLGICYDL